MTIKMTAAAALAVLATAGAAEAATGPQTARFVAHVAGVQTTTWDVPRWDRYRDCQGQRWEQGKGTEKIRFSTKPMRVLATKMPLADTPQLRYGGWNQFGEQRATALSARGKIVRDGKQERGIEPAECFEAGAPTVTDTGPYDCGTRTFSPDVRLEWRGSDVFVLIDDLFVPIGAPKDFGNCPVMPPEGTDAGAFTEIGQRFPVADLFDRSQGLIIVLGRETFTGEVASGHGTATTTTKFTLRLRRAR